MAISLLKLPAAERERIGTLADLAPERRRLLDEPVYATLATLRGGGPPHLTVVWRSCDDTHLYVNSAKGRIKDVNLRARPDLSLMTIDPKDPYHWLSVDGRVVEIVDEEDADPARARAVTAHIDDLAEAYVGRRPYPNRSPGEVRVMYKIAPSRITVFGPLR